MAFKMKYEIIKDYLQKGTKRRPGGCIDVAFMVAHDTGNPGSTAKGNISYYRNTPNIAASAQIFADDKEIRECVPFLTGPAERAYHVIYNVTMDNKRFGDDANDIAGGVELCWGEGIDSAEAYKRYIWVLAYSCYKHGLNPAKAIIGHEILDPGRKIDPGNGLKYMGKTYGQMLKDVVAEYNECLHGSAAEIVVPQTNVSGAITTKPSKPKEDNQMTVIQKTLNSLYKTGLVADGIYGPKTETALLKGLQKEINKQFGKKLTVDGKWGPKTKAAAPTVREGATGNITYIIQSYLFAKGYNTNGVDGIFGGGTTSAVKKFQGAKKISKDGIAGPGTFEKMFK